MVQIQNLYLEFLANFPVTLRPVISIALAVLIIYSIVKIVKKDFIFIIVILVLLPASKPIFQNIWEGVVSLIKFLLGTK